MMIEDRELREAFKVASEEHLQKLEAGLLNLESYVSTPQKIQELLREAHSLKGDANMLGLRDVGALAHHIEEILSKVQRAELVLSSEVNDRLYQGLDAIAKLSHEAVTGEPASINPFYTLAYLMGAPSPVPSGVATSPALETSAEDTVNKTHPEVTETESPILPVPSPVAAVDRSSEFSGLPTNSNGIPAGVQSVVPNEPLLSFFARATDTKPLDSPIPKEDYRIESVRVETQKLDALMTQVGELTVTKTRIEHRLTEIEKILSLWEEWSRDMATNRFVLNHLDSQISTIDSPQLKNSLNLVQNFYKRTEGRLEVMGTLLGSLKSLASEDSAKLDSLTSELEGGICTLRLLPLSTVFNLFPRTVRDLAKQQSKAVNFIIEGGETRADKRILEAIKDPLMHLIRNAISHGIETPKEREVNGKPTVSTLRLRGSQHSNYITIELIDDGQGLNLDRIKQTALDRGIIKLESLSHLSETQLQSLIFAPGFSTVRVANEISGRGVGLDVVRANVEQLKGTVQVESLPGRGCIFCLQLPATLATAPMLIVEAVGTPYALPVECVQTSLLIEAKNIFTLQNQKITSIDNRPISVVSLAELLELETELKAPLQNNSTPIPCIILNVKQEYFGLLVDAVIDQQDIVIKHQSKLLKRVRNVAGATILSTGEVCIILNPDDLLKSVQRNQGELNSNYTTPESHNPLSVLLIEDSLIVRTQEKRLLESAGYQVVTAVDGLDGWQKLKTRHFDAVVTDIQMPNLDGLALTSKIRQSQEYEELPVILVTSLAADADKKKGVEVGANAYLVKGDLQQKQLLETLNRLT